MDGHDSAIIKRSARTAGLLYLAMSVLAIFSFFYLGPRFSVAGDAAATARAIMSNEQLYRLRLLTDLLTQLLFIFVVVYLYRLFKDVDRHLATLMLVLVGVGIAAQL